MSGVVTVHHERSNHGWWRDGWATGRETVQVSDWAGIDPGARSGAVTPHTAPPERSSAPARPVRLAHPTGRAVVGATDVGGRILQRRARVLVLGSAFFVLPVLVLELVSTWLTFDRFESLEGAVVSLPELAGGIEAATGVETLLWYLSLVANSLAVALVGGLATVVALDDRAGRPVTLAHSLSATIRRSPVLIVGWLLGHSWVVVASLVMVNVDGLALVGLAALASPVLLAVVALMLFVSPVVIAERAGPITAVRRSVRLSRARWGATTAFVVVSGLVGLWVRFGVTFLPRLAETTGLVTFGSAGWLVEGAAGQIARLLAVPLVAVATAVCYLEVRMQVEGIDLTAEAERAFRVRR